MIHLYDLVKQKPLTNYERNIQLKKIEDSLIKECGPNTNFKFLLGERVNDIFTYHESVVVSIIDQYCQNGWNFYVVKDLKRTYTLREKDLTKANL